MLTGESVLQIAGEVAKAHLPAGAFDRAVSEPTTDSEGREALRITLVIAPGATDRISGDAALNTLFHIQKRLNEAGDDRFPIVEYATSEEFAGDADSES
jgi:hypothetical protein